MSTSFLDHAANSDQRYRRPLEPWFDGTWRPVEVELER